jgi:cysteinyl-tRNA synthetase
MDIRFTNTLTRHKELFEPIKPGHVGIYTCGPTVYQFASIGNLRAYVFADVLRRMFEFNDYQVKQVINITDVGHLTDDASAGEDKMERSAAKEGRTAWEIASYYTDAYLTDLDRLNIRRPHVLPKATEHIKEQVAMIADLEARGFTYGTTDGIYFDTSKLPDYGRLSGQKLEEKEEGARVAINAEKRNPSDFALWKFSKPEEKRQMEWSSPWGVGFPGWHIECSAMSEKYLGSPFDLHTGGIDHIPVHHTNEIAQTEGARGHGLANYWLHNEFLQVDGGKMGKSLGNAYTLDDLLEKGYSALAFRYFCLQAHYRTPLNFTWEALTAAQNTLNNLYDLVEDWAAPTQVDEDLLTQFQERINDDLDTAGALAIFWQVARDEAIDPGVRSATILKFDEIFALSITDHLGRPLLIPEEIQELLDERQAARAQKDWTKSDALRDQIQNLGYTLEDRGGEQKLRLKH